MSGKFFINLDYESDERYDLAKFLQFTDNFDPLTSKIIEDIKNLPLFGFYNLQGDEYRPDTISNKIYGNTQYWWIILVYNNMISYNEIEPGTVLKYPSINSIEDILFSLKQEETASS